MDQNLTRICPETIAAMNELFDDPAGRQSFINKLISIFGETGAQTVHELATELSGSRDSRRLSQLAHKLKGMARNIGAHRLGDLCEHLEMNVAELTSDAISTLFQNIRVEYELSQQELESKYYRD